MERDFIVENRKEKSNKYLPILFIGMLFVLAAIMLCATPLQTKVEAADVNDLTYEIVDGEVMITDCAIRASGGLVIPETINGYPVKRIESMAFQDCTGLTSVTIPNGVIEIGISAFEYCDKLVNVNLPDSVTYIGSYAFSGCTQLTSIQLPKGITQIGMNAFSSTGYYKDETNWDDSVLYIDNWLIKAKATIDGKYVIKSGTAGIAENAFASCNKLTDIIIPDNVMYIGAYAFRDSTQLINITLPNSIVEIGVNAFYNTGYYNNSSNWENSILYIDNWLIKAKMTISGECVIKSGVVGLASQAFAYCESLKSIIIPDGVKYIPSRTFDGCKKLENVIMPDSMTYIGDYAFANCIALNNIIIPDDVTNIDKDSFYNTGYYNDESNWENSVLYIDNWLVKAKTTLNGNYTIKFGTVGIASNAFSNCTKLTNIIIPDGMKYIGDGAFYNTGYYNDESNWEDSVLYIDDWLITAKTTLGGDYTVKNGTKVIASFAFGNCIELAYIAIPDSITNVGDSAFSGCIELNFADFMGDAPDISGSAFEFIQATAFYPNGNNTWEENKKVDYGGELEWKPYGESCISASGVCGDSLTWNFENGTLYISGSGAMYDWARADDCIVPWYWLKRLIRNVELPIDITYIGNYAFYNCTALEKFELPAAITVGEYAFSNCDGVERINVPKRAVIKKYAFSNCDALSYVYIAGSAIDFSQSCFANCPLLLSAGPVDGNYDIEFAWIAQIPDYAFYGCTSLVSVMIPDDIYDIGTQAFKGCTSLNNITFEADAPSISSDCFQDVVAIGYYPYGYSGWEDATNQNYNGTITWKLYGYGSLSSLKIVNIPNKIIYSVGDSLEVTGLEAVAIYDSGYEVSLTTSELIVGAVDLLTSGKKTVTVQYEGFSTTFEIVVYDTRSVTVDASLYPESQHDYAANLNETKTFTYEGAFALTLTFSADTFTEANIDYIYLYDGDGNEIAKYSGKQAAGKTVQIPGDTFRIRLESDESDGGYGYAFDSIVASVVVQDEVRFKSASLVLQDDLTVNFKVDKALFEEKGYTNPYVVFTFNGKETVVRNYTVDGNRYVFSFCDVAPNQMNDAISATLYVTYDGVEYTGETRTYSVAEYCYSMLELYSDDAYAELRTLLVDLLHYGAKSQIYTAYKTDALVDADLTEAELLWGTSGDPVMGTVLNTTYKTVENPTATWKGAGLHLQESVSVRLKFTAESIENLTVKIESEEETWTIASDKFIAEDGAYYVYFSGLDAGQMRQTLYLTLCNGDTPVSNTACYSIESYAYEKQNSTIDGLAELVKAMMRYGDSAYAYAN